ncbi:MAG: hypothetical protein ABEJ97_02710 [Halobellus sp.]
MTKDTLDLADKIAMYVGTGLILLAIPVIGFLTTITGSMSPLYKYQVTTEAGKKVVKYGLASSIPEGATVLQAPLVAPMTRGWIAFIGLAILALYAIYRVVEPKTSGTEHTTSKAQATD